MKREPWVNRVQGGVEHCAHGVPYKEICGDCWGLKQGETLPSNPPLPEYSAEFLAANFPNRKDSAILSGPYTPAYLAKREIERLTAELDELMKLPGMRNLTTAWAERDRLQAAISEALLAFNNVDTNSAITILHRALAGEDRPKDRPADETNAGRCVTCGQEVSVPENGEGSHGVR